MSDLIIIRGLPGSGKSMEARALQAFLGAMVIEPDALLITGGKYLYTKERYDVAKKRSLEMVTTCGLAGADVIYADVLPTVRDVEDVIDAYCAGWAKPNIRMFEMDKLTVDESFERNNHQVRREDIEKMAVTWEPWEVKK